MWQLTGISRILHYKNQIQEKYLKNLQQIYPVDKYKKVFNHEINCIKKSTNVLFITDELYNYCENNYNSLKISENFELDIILGKKKNNMPKIFYNCSTSKDITPLIPKPKKIVDQNNPFIIGYSGSIVYYEGIYEAVIAIEELIRSTNLNIEVHILGNINTIIEEETKFGIYKYRELIKKSFVKLISKVTHDKVEQIQRTFDFYMIPRLDLPVTNIVSPIKPFEPLSLKIPLIMSDCLCLNKISKNGENCVIFKKNNFKDFKEKVLQIIMNGYKEELLENGYNFIINERSWEKVIKDIQLYEML
jgi:glycosyltransferase involved in cell wall biosynthesis